MRLDEGVAFYGRAGEAIMASMARLGVDPLEPVWHQLREMCRASL